MSVMQAQMRELQFERDELFLIHNADSGMFDAYGLLEGDSKENDSYFGDVNNDGRTMIHCDENETTAKNERFPERSAS
jgi:hypothetical protein